MPNGSLPSRRSCQPGRRERRSWSVDGSPRSADRSGGDDLDEGPAGVVSYLDHGQLGASDRSEHVVVEPATAAHASPDWRHPALQRADQAMARPGVLEEPDRPARAQDAPSLAQAPADVADRTQDEGRDHGVERGVRERASAPASASTKVTRRPLLTARSAAIDMAGRADVDSVHDHVRPDRRGSSTRSRHRSRGRLLWLDRRPSSEHVRPRPGRRPASRGQAGGPREHPRSGAWARGSAKAGTGCRRGSPAPSGSTRRAVRAGDARSCQPVERRCAALTSRVAARSRTPPPPSATDRRSGVRCLSPTAHGPNGMPDID